MDYVVDACGCRKCRPVNLHFPRHKAWRGQVLIPKAAPLALGSMSQVVSHLMRPTGTELTQHPPTPSDFILQISPNTEPSK